MFMCKITLKKKNTHTSSGKRVEEKEEKNRSENTLLTVRNFHIKRLSLCKRLYMYLVHYTQQRTALTVTLHHLIFNRSSPMPMPVAAPRSYREMENSQKKKLKAKCIFESTTVEW